MPREPAIIYPHLRDEVAAVTSKIRQLSDAVQDAIDAHGISMPDWTKESQTQTLRRYMDFVQTVVECICENGRPERTAEIRMAIESGTLNVHSLQALLSGFPVLKITDEPPDHNCGHTEEFIRRKAEHDAYLKAAWGAAT